MRVGDGGTFEQTIYLLRRRPVPPGDSGQVRGQCDLVLFLGMRYEESFRTSHEGEVEEARERAAFPRRDQMRAG